MLCVILIKSKTNIDIPLQMGKRRLLQKTNIKANKKSFIELLSIACNIYVLLVKKK